MSNVKEEVNFFLIFKFAGYQLVLAFVPISTVFYAKEGQAVPKFAKYL